MADSIASSSAHQYQVEDEPDVEAGLQAAADSLSSEQAQTPRNGADQHLVENQTTDVEAGLIAADTMASSSAPTHPPPNGADEDRIQEEPNVDAGARADCDGRNHSRQGAETQIQRTAGGDRDRTSPLYRAIFLSEVGAPDKIKNADLNSLSNCGPNGQNVLHVAALRSTDLTQMVLERRNSLRNVADGSGSTPLHFAASGGVKGVTALLVQGDTNGVMRPDNNGMRPIHIAASVGSMDAIQALVGGDDDNYSPAALRDANGGTFLHVAVANKKTNVVKFACREPRPASKNIFLNVKTYLVDFLGGQPRTTFRSILNMKDNDGNTALHLAVKNRDESSFSHLVGNRYVDLNRVNKDGYTPLDLACKIKTENSFASRRQQNPTEWMIRVLAHSGAYFTARRRDLKFVRVTENDQHQAALPAPPAATGGGVAGTATAAQSNKHQADDDLALATETESVMVASALIATLTFAAAFTVPGAYKTDGTPALGSLYGFKVFIVADALAFFCSVAATFSLAEYANRGGVDPLVRRVYAQRAVWLFHVALRSIIVAFALGVSVVMWDISFVTTIIVSIATFAIVLYGNEALAHDIRLVRVMYRRFGFLRSGTLHPSTSSHLDWSTWRLRSFYATIVWNIVKLVWTYGVIFIVAYIAQLLK